MSAPAIVWFRRDLRLAENPALEAAIDSGSAIVPLFVWAPGEEAPWTPGGVSEWWLHQSLAALDESLRARGSKLILRRGPTLEALSRLAEETGARSVYWNRLYEPASIARDREVKAKLRELNLSAESHPGSLLIEPWKLKNKGGEPFRVFTPFWKACVEAYTPPRHRAAPEHLARPDRWPHSPDLSELALEPRIDWAKGIRETWRPGEAMASETLDTFLREGWKEYEIDRDRPDRRGTSRLSPYLHFGEITPHQIWKAARKATPDDPYLRQIVWREFAHHLLYHFPDTTSQPLRPEFRKFPWKMSAKLLKSWTRGETGYPLVDAGMRELWHTGWMHNRVRMVVASFLVKHLLIPWQEGAAWFWDTLVDADLANNTLGWQWVAGCGADAAPYFRIFNPAAQGKKFDPKGEYVRQWVPELAGVPDRWIHQPWKAPSGLPSSYIKPVVVHEEARARALEAFAQIRRA